MSTITSPADSVNPELCEAYPAWSESLPSIVSDGEADDWMEEFTWELGPDPADTQWWAEQNRTWDWAEGPDDELHIPFADRLDGFALEIEMPGTAFHAWVASKVQELARQARLLFAGGPEDFEDKAEAAMRSGFSY